MTTVSVVLAEDSLLVREGLVALLAAPRTGIEVVGVCGALPELLDLVDEARPDVVITDIRMPPGHHDEGVQAVAWIRQHHPDIGVVVISQFAEPEYVLAVLGDGSAGRGYVVKDHIDDEELLVRAVHAVAVGGSFIDDHVIEVLLDARTRAVESPLAALSDRERDVLAEIAAGRSNRSIAATLGVSVHAVEKHASAIFTKLDLVGDDEINRRVSAVLLFLTGQRPDRP